MEVLLFLLFLLSLTPLPTPAGELAKPAYYSAQLGVMAVKTSVNATINGASAGECGSFLRERSDEAGSASNLLLCSSSLLSNFQPF